MKLSKVILSTIAAQGIVSFSTSSNPLFDPDWPYSMVLRIFSPELYLSINLNVTP